MGVSVRRVWVSVKRLKCVGVGKESEACGCLYREWSVWVSVRRINVWVSVKRVACEGVGKVVVGGCQ